jgi:signal transduction histidine kinase
MRARLLRFFASAALWCAGLAFAQTPAQLGLEDRTALWSALQTLPDALGVLSAEQASAEMDKRAALGQAQQLPSQDHAYGKWIPYPYWASMRLVNANTTAQTWVLSFESPTQDVIHLWQSNPQSGPPAWQRIAELDDGRVGLGSGQLFPSWRVTLAAGEERSFLIRLDGHNMMRFPLYAMRDDAYTLQQRGLSFGIGFVLAIPLVVMLFVLTLIRSTSDKSVPLFLVMALAEFVGANWVSGQMHASFPWISRELCGWIGLGGYALLLGLSSIHSQVFLQTRQQSPKAHAMLGVLIAWWLFILPIYAYLRPESARLCLLLGGVGHALVLLVIACQAYGRNQEADAKTYLALFVTVWLVYLGSGIFYLSYRAFSLPVYSTLMVNFVQGSLVAALLGCVVSAQVVRRKNQVEQAAARALDRNHLYTAAHHDLWQPIQSIGLQVAALEGIAGTNPEQASKYYRGIQSAVNHVHDFVDGLRHIDMPPSLQEVDLDALLEPLIEECRLMAKQKHISFTVRPSHLAISTDPALLMRIVRNLLSNAIRYTNAGGRVIVGVRRERGQIWLMVYDNGIGMTDAQAAASFEAFARFGDTARVPEGMGIGLYSVKRIAQQLGLPTRLKSRLGKGTSIGLGLIPINSLQNPLQM